MIQKIWIDADACPQPVKESTYKAALRLNIAVTLVANSSMHIPSHHLIDFIKVAHGADVADQYIIDNAKTNELVITADIPLASAIVHKGLYAINPRGEIYDEENVGEILASRDLMKELRDSGIIQGGGPKPFTPKDVQNFTNSLNKILSRK